MSPDPADAGGGAGARCRACGEDLPAGARFCPGCGVALAAETPAEERRVVTVLFADIEGFTTLAEHRDPERVKELLDASFGRLVPVVLAHGGNVDKIIGDEIMAVFGAPLAHEDDPERAVRAALALAPALAEVDPSLRLRVGVNTGEVMAGAVGPSSGYTVTGDVVNTAHRLATEAEPGAVLVGDRTRAATTSAVTYELRGDLALRGRQDRVRAWVATGVVARPRHRPRDGAAAPLVGRTRELAELRAEVGSAMADRRAEVITIVGEAGVGKTRLATELAVLLATKPATAQVLWSSCPPYGPGGDLTPLVDLVRAGLGIAASQDRDRQAELLAERVEAVAASTGSDAGRLRSRLGLLLGLEPVTSRPAEPESGPVRAGLVEQQLGAVLTVVTHLAHSRPLLVVIDDLHWAGPALLRFLAQVPDRLTGHPVVVLGLARDDLLERRSAVATGPAQSTRSLEPLAARDASELVRSLLRAYAESEPVRIGPSALARLVDAAGGNPLLADQLVHYLVESGALVEERGRWRWTTGREGSEAELPDGVRSLIGARLDGLPPDERAVIADAAVFGRRFWRAAVADLGGITDIDARLERLHDRGLTTAIADDGHGDVAFRHVLTRDVAYASLPIGERAIRHARAAAWLERHVDTVGESGPLAELAYHYERAVVLSRSLDHTDPGLSGAAFLALVRAARDEHRRHGVGRADHWYRRARDLGSPDPEAMIEAVAEHGSVLLELRQLDAARDAFEELHRRAGHRRPAEQASAVAHLGAVARLEGDVDLARERFDAAIAAWRGLGDGLGEADALRLQGWSEITVGRARAALPRFQQAAALEARLGDGPRRGETLRYLGWCELLAGELGSAREHLWTGMALAHEAGDQGSVGWCFGLLAQILLHVGQASLGLDVARNLRAVAASNQDPSSEWTAATLEASATLALGRVDEAAALARAAELRFEELDEAWGLALARLVRGRAARLAGDLVTARSVLRLAVGATREVAYVGEDARLLAELARVELEAGELAEAERQARGALALVRAGIGDHESGVRSLSVLGEVERRRGARDVAELLLEEAAAERAPDDRTDGWRAAALALAGLRLEAGDLERASWLLAQVRDPTSEDVEVGAELLAAEARLASAPGRPTPT